MEIFSKMFTVSIQIKPAAHWHTLFCCLRQLFFYKKERKRHLGKNVDTSFSSLT